MIRHLRVLSILLSLVQNVPRPDLAKPVLTGLPWPRRSHDTDQRQSVRDYARDNQPDSLNTLRVFHSALWGLNLLWRSKYE